MTKKPPVPPASRSPHDRSIRGPGSDPSVANDNAGDAIKPTKPPKNLREQGDEGNIEQNTTHQGYQQDR
jgi:hypothetical protein